MLEHEDWIKRECKKWRNFPRSRPANVQIPEPGQESVWDYPRPPRVEPIRRRVYVQFEGLVLADTRRAYRVLETASPPVYYFPPLDVRTRYLLPSSRSTLCEWKGIARYWSIRVGRRFVDNAAWSYPEPFEGCDAIRDYLAFFPGKMEACFVGEHQVTAQASDFYGGWITPEIVGPFKGEPGTEGW